MTQDALQIPAGSYNRRLFFFVVAGTVALLLLARFLAVPWLFGSTRPDWSDVVDQTLGNVVATVLAGVILGVLILWLAPRTPSRAEISTLGPKEIGETLQRALATSREWRFNGATGRWFRAVAVPELARRARQAGTTRRATALIIDPTDEALVTNYGAFRSKVEQGGPTAWTPSRVRQDIYATILVAYGTAAAQPQLTTTIFLKRSASVLRYDLSASIHRLISVGRVSSRVR